MNGLINVGELVKRIIKYLVEGLMVAIAAYAIPKRSLNIEEIILIALTAAATFSILDTYIPVWVPLLALVLVSVLVLTWFASLVGFKRSDCLKSFKDDSFKNLT
jgi:Ca2+/Na+ antiporter